jgi:hypothetical protein
VDRHELHGSINGGPPVPLATGIFASAVSTEVDLALGQNVDVFVRTFGDNGTQADSAHVTFTVQNGESVQPVSGLTANWLQHIP